MGFKIRNLMIKLSPDETDRRICTLGTDHSDHCIPQTACCTGCDTSQQRHGPCEGRSRAEDPDRPGGPEENRAGAEPSETFPGLGRLRQQLRQTLSQAD